MWCKLGVRGVTTLLLDFSWQWLSTNFCPLSTYSMMVLVWLTSSTCLLRMARCNSNSLIKLCKYGERKGYNQYKYWTLSNMLCEINIITSIRSPGLFFVTQLIIKNITSKVKLLWMVVVWKNYRESPAQSSLLFLSFNLFRSRLSRPWQYPYILKWLYELRNNQN